jgi:hypothetical protein
VVAVGGEACRDAGNGHTEIVAVAPGVTALGVNQRRTPSVTDPAGRRTELLPPLVSQLYWASAPITQLGAN